MVARDREIEEARHAALNYRWGGQNDFSCLRGMAAFALSENTLNSHSSARLFTTLIFQLDIHMGDLSVHLKGRFLE